MDLLRWFRHALIPRWWAMRAFGAADRRAIAAAVADSERQHRGELRVALEGPLPLGDIVRNISVHARAAELFGRLRVWDTAENSGILIYLQLVDRRVEILADRGIAVCVTQDEWDALCRSIETGMQAGNGCAGVLSAIERTTQLLAKHFPAGEGNPNELPNNPVVL